MSTHSDDWLTQLSHQLHTLPEYQPTLPPSQTTTRPQISDSTQLSIPTHDTPPPSVEDTSPSIISDIPVSEIERLLSKCDQKTIKKGHALAHCDKWVTFCNEPIENERIKAKCRAQMKKSTVYTVELQFNNNKFVSGKCTCWGGSDGKCKHTVAVLLRMKKIIDPAFSIIPKSSRRNYVTTERLKSLFSLNT